MLFKRNKQKTDKQLMVAIQNGDHRAFALLYERYATRLKSFFYRMLWSDDAKAEDCVHDLFSKLIEKPESYDSEYEFKPWVFQVAMNMCKNQYRKRAFEKDYLEQLHDSGVIESSIERKLDEEIFTDRVHQILADFDEEKRTLFLLRYQQEMSVEELAQLFEIPAGTIKSRLFSSRKQIEKELKHMSNEG